MPKIMDHVEFLSQEIGPRPAGTEEEQQAALYIAEQFQKDADLSAVIEDFSSVSNAHTPRVICCTITLVFGLLSLFLPVLAIPAIVLTAISAVLVILEIMGRPIISRVLARGVSQNIVAKHEPNVGEGAPTSRRRKVILVARYDSGKVVPEYKGFMLRILPLLYKFILGGIVFIPLLLIVRNVFFLHAVGALAITLNVLMGIALVLVAIPIVFAIMHKIMGYNEAANSNGAGVAVLLDVARRLNQGGFGGGSLGADDSGVVIHGEHEARRQGVVPDGAPLAYETAGAGMGAGGAGSSDGLAAAKAAIAVLSGQPIPEQHVETTDAAVAGAATGAMADAAAGSGIVAGVAASENTEKPFVGRGMDALFGQAPAEPVEAQPVVSAPVEIEQPMRQPGVQPAEQPVAQPGVQPAAQPGVQPVAQPAITNGFGSNIGSSTGSSGVPDWFKRGQEQAKKESRGTVEVQRSRFADALDAAEGTSTQFSQTQDVSNTRIEEQLQKMRNGIMEAQAPQAIRHEQPTVQPAPEVQQRTQPAMQPAVNVAPPVPVQPPVQPVEKQQSAPGAVQAPPVEPADPNSTTAMAPIDVTNLEQSGPSNQIHVEESTKRGPIRLPDIAPVAEVPSVGAKQRAPLAQAEESGADTAKGLLNMLPSIDLQNALEEQIGGGTTAENVLSAESTDNLSSGETGEVAVVDSPSSTGSFTTVGTTGSFAPVGEELIANVDPDELYIDDADDSDYEEGITETGAFAGPDYVDMPKSRVRKLFGIFGGKKKEKEDVSTQEWLDVDEDFDAHSVGAERGGWESFQPEDEEDGWQGGAFSLRRKKKDADTKADEHEGETEVSELSNESVEAAEPEPESRESRRQRRTAALNENPVLKSEQEGIYEFRYADIDTEVWLVALGSELANNSGMRAFISEHEQELRGSIIINLDALGAGSLSMVEQEGVFKKAKTSSRLKRYVRRAGQAMGLTVPSVSMPWKESSASCATKAGFQAMSLVGVKDGKPAYFAEGDDILENIDEDVLNESSDLVMEILKSI